MSLYNETDIAVTPSGDLSLDSTGGFPIIVGSGVLQQDIAFRLRTDYDDFTPHPEIGADLVELIGEPNTREVVKFGETKIIHSLTHDARIRNVDLYVRGVPVALEKVIYYVFVNDGIEQINVTPSVVFNMMTGLTNIPGA